MPSTIVLLGAPGTGVQALADALAAHLASHPSPLPIAHSTLPQAIAASDAAQHAAALDSHRAASLTLLMGLDLACPPEEQPLQQAADAQLRAALDTAAIGYRVVYGQGPARLASALRALESVVARPPGGTAVPHEPGAPRMVAWGCEKCSDPVCEHRLFTALTTRPPAPGCA